MPRLISISLLLTVFISDSRAEDAYFTTIYSAQRPIINLPKYSHTWATFVKVSQDGPNLPCRIENFTISWLPASLEMRPLSLRGEKGVNLPLKDTINWCRKNDAEIRQFGPFRIDPELYCIEQRRWGVLERGERLYHAADLVNEPEDEEYECNCTYAVAAPVTRIKRVRPATLNFGFLAGAFVLRRFEPYIYNDTKTEPWVSDLIGVENFRQMRLGIRPPAE